MVSEPRQTETADWRRRATRWWCVMRYHRPSQLAMRFVRVIEKRSRRRRWWSHCGERLGGIPAVRNNPDLAALARRKFHDRAGQAASQRAEQIREGRYEFLHREHSLPDPVDWRLESHSGTAHLWRFHLHYHEFLLDLAAKGLETGETAWFDRAWQLVLDWIEHNRLDDDRVLADAWHPYCISRRLPVWLCLWLAAPPDPTCQERILGSMLWQMRYLDRHLEWDVRGNHLLENLRAMALMGAFFAGSEAERWLDRAATLLTRELAEQILPHGEHFERSPMYHAEMLEAVLDVRDAVAGLRPDLAEQCHVAGRKMAAFLRAILHPDGEIPLLGDACLGQGPHLAARMDRAEEDALSKDALPRKATSGAEQVGNYWVYRNGGEMMLFDAGPVGPDHLPAHAHADLLSLEASIGGRRLFVDSGVYNYDDDPMRQYCRSTAAHNVLQIDGQDQCDMWSRFRMGSRGWPSGLAHGKEAGFSWARAQHNAYRRLGVPVVGRWVACRPGGPWFCIDWAEGKGTHELTASLHLHPEVHVEQVADARLRLTLNGMPFQLEWLTPGLATVSESWYCPELGRRQQAPVVRWQASRALPAVCGWCLTWGDCEGTASLAGAGSNLVLQWAGRDEAIQFPSMCQLFSA
jgi:uncharacterized heparinase superfamily protein